MDASIFNIKRSLTGKLITAIGLLILTGGGVSWYAMIHTEKSHLMSNAVVYTSSYSDLVRKSVNYNMLTFNRKGIQHTIESMGSSEGIEGVRIFDSRGTIFYSSKRLDIGRQVDKNSFACGGCHTNPQKPLGSFRGSKPWVTYTGRQGFRILTYVEPIYNEPSCYTSACHVHPKSQKVLGILQTDFSLRSLDSNIARQEREITVYALVLMGLSALVIYFVLRKFVLDPVDTISEGMKKVAVGDLGNTIELSSEDEMGTLAGNFNTMTRDLEKAKEKVDRWTQTLEAEVAKKVAELRRSQDKLIQAEKLASLGRLTADVAHEIRNPLTAIGGFAHRLDRIVDGGKQKEYSEIIITEVGRLERILKDILTFSRDARFHLERHPVGQVLREAMKIYEDLCMERFVRPNMVIRDGLPQVLIDKDQVHQALGNLITNAVDAMPDGGTLTVEAGQKELHDITYVFLRVSDSGKGIPQEKLPLIFEPFFSTKEIHGTGLGLSITRKIIEEHGGFIEAQSVEGEGAVFTLYFPYQGEEESMQAKCWEVMKCGRDRETAIRCPAYPNFGRACWAVAGTFCEGKAQGTFAQKYESCRQCEFYRKISSEAAGRSEMKPDKQGK